MDKIKSQFDTALVYICKIIRSCETREQLEHAYTWGMEIVSALNENLRCKDPQRYDFCHVHVMLPQRLDEIRECYRQTMDRIQQLPPKSVRMQTRELAPYIGICPSCGGAGITPKDGAHECGECCGSGRVKIRQVIHTTMKPFISGEDDPKLPVTMR